MRKLGKIAVLDGDGNLCRDREPCAACGRGGPDEGSPLLSEVERAVFDECVAMMEEMAELDDTYSLIKAKIDFGLDIKHHRTFAAEHDLDPHDHLLQRLGSAHAALLHKVKFYKMVRRGSA